uniref:Uncharacterized protein n=1 Tax=Oryza rufipogon TaxID=4529 RepID=A0A0E0QZS0_ORYRU
MAVETTVARWKASEEMGSALHAVVSRRRCSKHCSSSPLCVVGGKNRRSPRTAGEKEARTEDDLILHLIAGGLQLGGPPSDGL